ncbi:hypothetical protein F7Q91_15770 [Vibrio chagasii]|uniref:Uncharacterized protein n=1 Tax=Vibrio chagasii TaxID=170679 RepID=A0A7V7NSG1_9VIBR|nr:hypothetical protein [Vibrio chagasii]KAB0478829.1 hypothetical protein F7Q91_15770 [Vibrio chagasii]
MIQPKFYKRELPSIIPVNQGYKTLSGLLSDYQSDALSGAIDNEMQSIKSSGFLSNMKAIVSKKRRWTYQEILAIKSEFINESPVKFGNIELIQDANFHGVCLTFKYKSLTPSIFFQSTKDGFIATAINYNISSLPVKTPSQIKTNIENKKDIH